MNLCAAALCLSITPVMVCAADRCAELRKLLASAEARFPDTAPAEILATADKCTIADDERGGKTYLCLWQYPYRDAAAGAAFRALSDDIRTCLDEIAILPADTAVNHPDSYLLHRFRRGNVVISVSLKDKAALRQSLVFLRIDRE